MNIMHSHFATRTMILKHEHCSVTDFAVSTYLTYDKFNCYETESTPQASMNKRA